MKPEKEKDQHIMIDSKMNETIVDAASVNSKDEILEIGGGSGNLTELLARHARFVYAVEKDEAYSSMLSKKFSSSDNVAVISGNILDVKLPKFNKIVSNPPYQILESFFFRLVYERRWNFECCVITVPHGFAKIITAKPSEDKFGLLSALFFAFYDVNDIAEVSKEAFSPMPRVTSRLIRITPKSGNDDFLQYFFKNIFLQRGKKIRNTLLGVLWNNCTGTAGKRLTKNEAKALIKKIDNGKLVMILDKKASQLSNRDVRELFNISLGENATIRR